MGSTLAEVKSLCDTNSANPLTDKISRAEVAAFLIANGEIPKESAKHLEEKIAWRKTRKSITIKDVAPFLRSKGFTTVLPGAYDKRNQPVVYTYGMPFGSVEEVEKQTIYQHERVMEAWKDGDSPTFTILVNAKSPSFR